MYTEKFGLIYTAFQSVRELRSKMRFHTHKLSFVTVDLVRGKDIWRVTGIHEDTPVFDYVDTPWFVLLDNLAQLLQRLCAGEDPQSDLWGQLSIIKKQLQKTVEPATGTEILLVARILYYLGYWNGNEKYICIDTEYTPEILSWVQTHKTSLVQLINQGIKDSQL